MRGTKLRIAKDCYEPRVDGRKRHWPGWTFRRFPAEVTRLPLYIDQDGRRVAAFDFVANFRAIERKSSVDGVNCIKDSLFFDLFAKVKAAVDLYGENYCLIFEATRWELERGIVTREDGRKTRCLYRPDIRKVSARLDMLESVATVVYAGSREAAEAAAWEFFMAAPDHDREAWAWITSPRRRWLVKRRKRRTKA